MDLKELLHDIVDELHHLPASAKAEWHAKVDEAVGAVKDGEVQDVVNAVDGAVKAEAPVVAPPAK
jgi:hypothetical protein